ncbi:MAG: type 4a pilus biogenesis protein PilO [Phycisphaeraceae bacterium]
MRIESDIVKTACVVALLCGVYGGVVFWPSQKQNQALAGEIQTKREQLAAKQPPNLAPLRGEIAELRAELRDSAVELPEGASPHRVLDGLSEAITSNGVTVYDTSQRPSKTFARFAVTPVDLQFNTGFENAFAVLRSIESSNQPLRVERLEMTGSADETTGHVGVSLQLSSFYLADPAQGGRR